MKNAFSLVTMILLGSLTVKAQEKKVEKQCLPGDACCSKAQTLKSNDKSMETANTKNKKVVACKLTSPELQKRKAEVLASLKAKVIQRKELANGYQYQFDGTDEILEELVQFIRTERACCNFFTFQLMVEDAGSPVLLTITGPDGAKEFIIAEMDL